MRLEDGQRVELIGGRLSSPIVTAVEAAAAAAGAGLTHLARQECGERPDRRQRRQDPRGEGGPKMGQPWFTHPSPLPLSASRSAGLR
jgi:hypothetical protein